MDGLLPSAWFFSLSGVMFPGGANLLLHSTVIIATGLVAARLLKPRGAALQSLILRVALSGVLVSPIVTAMVSELGIRGLTVTIPQRLFEPDIISSSFNNRTISVSFPESHTLIQLSPVSESVKKREPLAVIADRRGLGYPEMFRNLCRLAPVMIPGVVAAWFLLSAVLLLQFVFSIRRISRVRTAAVTAGDDIVRRCTVLAERMGVRVPAVLESPFVGSPFIAGIVKPAILLPENCGRVDMIGDDVLLHELAHLARWDCFWSMLGKIGNVIIPFQPLLRLLQREIDDTSDLVCDDYVLKYSSDPHAYACRLFDIADCYHRPRTLYVPVANLVSFNSLLGRRIERILDTTRAISIGTGKRSVIRVGMLCLLLTVLLGFTGFRTMRPSVHMEDLLSAKTGASPVPEIIRFTYEWNTTGTESDGRVLLKAQLDEGSGVDPVQPVKTAEVEETVDDSAPPTGSGTKLEPVAKVPDMLVEHHATYPVYEEREKAGSVSGVPGADHADEVSVTVSQAGVATPPPPVAIPAVSETTPTVTEKPGHEARVAESSFDVPEAPHPAVPADRKECLREGKKRMESGDYAAAHELFLAALAKKPDDPETMCCLGKSSFGNRNNEQAILFFKNAIAKNPRFAEAHYRLGDVYLAMGDLDQAMKHHKAAIQLNSAYSRLSRAYY